MDKFSFLSAFDKQPDSNIPRVSQGSDAAFYFYTVPRLLHTFRHFRYIPLPGSSRVK